MRKGTRLWAALLVLAGGCSSGSPDAARFGDPDAQGRLCAPDRATAGVPVALGVVFADGRGVVPGETCFRFGDASGDVCAAQAFVSHTFAAPGRYRVEATWPGCAGSCDASREVEVTAGAGALLLFRPPAAEEPVPFLDIPFPNDLYLDPDTGRMRVGTLGAVLPVNDGVLEAALPELTGFGTSTAVYFPVHGEGPEPGLTAEAARSGAWRGSPVFLINVDPHSPEFRQRRPVECAFNAQRGLLVVRPRSGFPLLPETRYAAVITTSLWNVQGAFRPDESMERVLRLPENPGADAASGSPARADEAVAPRTRSVYEAVLRLILEEPDIPEAGVLAAVTPFTTQPTLRDLQAIRGGLQQRPVPQVRWTRIYDDPGELDDLLGSSEEHLHIQALAHGRYATEIYQTPDQGIFDPGDQRFRYDAQGNPLVHRSEELDVTLVLPKASRPTADGTPVVIFQHGISGNRVSLLAVADVLAEAGFATVGIDAVAHGSRSVWASADRENNQTGARGPDGFPDQTAFSRISAAEFFAYLLNVSAMRDNLRQTAVDLMQLVRLLQNPRLDLSPFPGAGLATERLYLLADSLGTMFSVLLLAVEPAVRVAVLNVAGGGLLTELVSRSPETVQWLLPFVPLLFGVPAETVLDPLDPVVNLLQTVIDPGDPVNLAPYVLRNPPEVDGRRIPPASVLQLMVEGDETVANASNEALARALGLPLMVPFVRRVPWLPETGSPVRANVVQEGGGVATAALVQCSPACHGRNLHSATGERLFVPEFPYPPGFREPFPRLPTPVTIRQPYREVQRQIVHFFTSFRDTGTAEVRAFWTPVLDWDDDGLPDDLERKRGTDPHEPDTDGDGSPDGEEVENGTDPLDPAERPG